MTTTGTTSLSGRRSRRSRRIRRIRGTFTRTFLVALATAAALSAPTLAAATTTNAERGETLRARQPLVAVGKGQVTGELPFCFNGAPGPCGWIVEGNHSGTPIRSGTVFAMIDDGNARSPRRCVPATYSGLLNDSATDTIAHVAEGRVCPAGAGRYVFTGRVEISFGTGRFREITDGNGRVRVSIAANGSTTLTLAGQIRIN